MVSAFARLILSICVGGGALTYFGGGGGDAGCRGGGDAVCRAVAMPFVGGVAPTYFGGGAGGAGDAVCLMSRAPVRRSARNHCP